MALTGRLKKWGRASGITAKKRKVLSGTGADSVVGRFVTLFFLPLCFTSTETVRLIRDGRMEVGEGSDPAAPNQVLPPPLSLSPHAATPAYLKVTEPLTW